MVARKGVLAVQELQRVVAEIEAQTERESFAQEGIPIVNAQIEFPLVTYRGFQKNAAVLSRFYSDGAARYLKFIRRTVAPAARRAYVQAVRAGESPRLFEAKQSFCCTYNAGLLSIYYDQYEYTGGAHGGTVRFSDTYYLPEGRFLRLRDLFRPGTRYKKLLCAAVLRRIEAQIGRNGAFYYDAYPRAVRKYFSADQFYLKREGLLLYYQQYTIAPYSMGIPTFLIPYAELEDMLRYQLKLGPDAE